VQPSTTNIASHMKRLLPFLLTLLICSCGPATSTTPAAPPAPPTIPANSLVQNGDFSQGTANWTGDAKPAQAPAKGITIKLDPAAWTRVYQTFHSGNGTQFSINVNYQLSPGMHASDDPADYAQITQKINLVGFDNYHSQNVNPHQFYGTLGNPGDSVVSSEVYDPNYNTTDVQNYQHTYPAVPASEQKIFCLAFPPGNGTVTLLGIAVTSNGN
jgi:hypothetical protein